MGRPPLYPIKKIIGFDQELLDAIDAWRRTQTPIPNVSEAVRVILTDWLVGHGVAVTQDVADPEED